MTDHANANDAREAEIARIREALDEMDRLATVHIQLQGDPTAIIKGVFEAESLRDRHEAYVGREARNHWLRTLLARIDALQAVADAARVLVQEPYYCGRVLTQALLDAESDPEYADIVRDCLKALDTVKQALAALEADAGSEAVGVERDLTSGT